MNRSVPSASAVPGFRHQDVERTIIFGRGALDRADEILPDGYTLMSTERALAQAGDVAGTATQVVLVPPGPVNDLAAELRSRAGGESALVALGGGRVIDVAKAIAAAYGGRRVIAIPTSLSAAEMTGIHRHARGVAGETPRVRPDTVLNDPAISASQPAEELAASTANALGHAITARVSDRSTPIAATVATEAAVHLTKGWAGAEPDRDRLALGALLAGWAVDHSGLGPHHALAQTAVREASLAHAGANAAVLPHSVTALHRRYPERLAALDAAIGGKARAVAEEIRGRAGHPTLEPLAADEPLLRRTIDIAASRPELRHAEPPFRREEIETIYRAAANTSTRTGEG